MLAFDSMRSGPVLLTLCIVLGASALSGHAAAQAIRAGALAPQIKSGGNTPELRDKFHEAVLRGLSSLNGPSGPRGELGEVISIWETRQKLGEELMSCGGQAACLGRAIAALRVNRLFSTELSVAGKSYTISMRLFDGQGHELTHVEELCEICTVREADESVAKAAQRLAAASRTFPIEAVVPEKTPEVAKPTPAPPPKEEPPPQPTASPMQASPNPQPTAPPPSKERRHIPWRPLGFGAVGLGIVGLAVGIPLLVIDGRPTCDAPDPTRACPEVYNTAGGGAAMIALGAIGLIGSVPLFYMDYRDRNRSAISSLFLRGGPLGGGASVTLGGSF